MPCWGSSGSVPTERETDREGSAFPRPRRLQLSLTLNLQLFGLQIHILAAVPCC